MLRRPLVAVDEVVQFKLVDVAGVELIEGFANVLQQRSELSLVVGLDDRPRLALGRFLVQGLSTMVALGHDARTYFLHGQGVLDPTVPGAGGVPFLVRQKRARRPMGRVGSY